MTSYTYMYLTDFLIYFPALRIIVRLQRMMAQWVGVVVWPPMPTSITLLLISSKFRDYVEFCTCQKYWDRLRMLSDLGLQTANYWYCILQTVQEKHQLWGIMKNFEVYKCRHCSMINNTFCGFNEPKCQKQMPVNLCSKVLIRIIWQFTVWPLMAWIYF